MSNYKAIHNDQEDFTIFRVTSYQDTIEYIKAYVIVMHIESKGDEERATFVVVDVGPRVIVTTEQAITLFVELATFYSS